MVGCLKKSVKVNKRLFSLSGEIGIRTLGTLRYTRFPIVHLRPLGHLSNPNTKEHRPLRPAERVGFEPTEALNLTRFRIVRLRPLGHLSASESILKPILESRCNCLKS